MQPSTPPSAPAAAPAAQAPLALVVMGVFGAGKTTIGRLLAASLGARLIEGDDHIPPANVAKMSRGEPLDDDDRHPWLRALAAEIARELRAAGPGVVYIHLAGSYELIAQRLSRRIGHFMPPSLRAILAELTRRRLLSGAGLTSQPGPDGPPTPPAG